MLTQIPGKSKEPGVPIPPSEEGEEHTENVFLNRTHFWNPLLSRKHYCLTLPDMFLDTMAKQRHHTDKFNCTVQLLESQHKNFHLFPFSSAGPQASPSYWVLGSKSLGIAETFIVTPFSYYLFLFSFSYPKWKQPEQLLAFWYQRLRA